MATVQHCCEHETVQSEVGGVFFIWKKAGDYQFIFNYFSAYPFKKSERIIGFFENFENYLDEDAMWQISENIKPRGGRSLASVK